MRGGMTAFPAKLRLGIPRNGQLIFFGDRHSEKAYDEALRRWTALGAELAELLARFPELADDRAIELHLVDLTAHRREQRVVVVGVRVRAEQILMRARADADRPRRANVVVDRPQRRFIAVHQRNQPRHGSDVGEDVDVPLRHNPAARQLTRHRLLRLHRDANNGPGGQSWVLRRNISISLT